jgi:hypothetical protein
MQKYTGILNSASIAGLVVFAYFILLYLAMGTEFVLIDFPEELLRESMTIRIHPFGGMKMIGAVVPVVFMYLAVKRFKAEEGEGFITYGRAFRVGVMFTFIYASLSAMLIFLFGSLIDGSFVDFANSSDARLIRMMMEADQVMFIDPEEQLKLIEQRGLADFALSDFWSKTSGGFIIALVIAAFLKQKPPTFDVNE